MSLLNAESPCISSRFKLELDPDHPVKHEIIVVMKTEDGIMMKATPRVRYECRVCFVE